MKYLSWLVTTPLTVIAILFIVSNHDKVAVKYWLYSPSYEVPLYVVGLAFLGLGFLAGSLFVSFRYYSLKHDYWKLKRRASRLEKELEEKNIESKVNDNEELKLPASNIKAISAN